MLGAITGKVDPIFTSNQENFGRNRSNNRNNVLWKHHPTQPGPCFIPSNIKQLSSFAAHTEKTFSNSDFWNGNRNKFVRIFATEVYLTCGLMGIMTKKYLIKVS